MTKFEKLQPGMVVFDVGTQKLGNTSSSTVAVWRVRIIAVNRDEETVLASWNGNTPTLFDKYQWQRWRLSEPVLVRSGFGHRLARRAELKALKESK